MTTPFRKTSAQAPRPVASAPQGLPAAALALALLFACAGMARAEPLAFPGAEGPGAAAQGGRGGQVLYVSTLADDGPGSLRAAVETQGARTILFAVDGAIALKSPLTIRHGQVTIAGQSAPGDGVMLRDQPLVIAADDVIVRYIRARLGDESGVEADAISISGGRRIILDHVSASWSVDETLSVASRYDPPEAGPYDVTVQWSIIAESLNRSRHTKGDHGYGTLVRGAYGARIAFHHNLWAHHRARMPRPGNYLAPRIDPTGPVIAFSSNVFYNWGGRFSGYDADKAQRATYAFTDNIYVPGPQSSGRLAFQEENAEAKAYFARNRMDGVTPADPWSLVEGGAHAGYRLTAAPDLGVAADDDPFEQVLAQAGASLRRDSVDARVVESVRMRRGAIIDSQAQVGGWPTLQGARPAEDGDRDGMPDMWERTHALDPRDGSDGARDRDRDGYTNLEEYLNDRVR
jgi:hypothetical protein